MLTASTIRPPGSPRSTGCTVQTGANKKGGRAAQALFHRVWCAAHHESKQLALIRRMAFDLDVLVEAVGVPTLRYRLADHRVRQRS